MKRIANFGKSSVESKKSKLSPPSKTQDKDKKQMKSSNLSMSRFRQYSIGSLYNSAKGAFVSTIEKIKDTYNDVKTKTDEIIKGLSV